MSGFRLNWSYGGVRFDPCTKQLVVVETLGKNMANGATLYLALPPFTSTAMGIFDGTITPGKTQRCFSTIWFLSIPCFR